MSGPGSPRFAQCERSLALFVRGLLGVSPDLRCAPDATARSFASDTQLFFPDRYALSPGRNAELVYFAAAAHLAAHARHGGGRATRKGLKPLQQVLVSLLEDARVEALMLRECPGLRVMWAPFQRAQPSELATFPALCARISRALFEANYEDPHVLVHRVRSAFWARGQLPIDRAQCRQLGSLLGNELGQLRLPFNAKEYRVEPLYRDDHRLQWLEDGEAEQDRPQLEEQVQLARLVEREGQGERSRRGSEASPASASERVRTGTSTPTEAEEPAVRKVCHYPEWDFKTGHSRPAHSTVFERRAPGASSAALPALARHPVQSLERAARSLLRAREQPRTRHDSGEELDLAASIAARIDLLANAIPDPRLYRRSARRERRLAVVLLLDLSASTGELAKGSTSTVLALEREACRLLATLLQRTGIPFALHGFASNGRARVEYDTVKNLDEVWDASALERLYSLTPRLSTRMGAALRHAGAQLATFPAAHRLVLLLTDGEPSDIDAHDPRYLLHDARHAVRELRQRKVSTFAVSLDPAAKDYVHTVFGAASQLVVTHIDQLPVALPRLFAKLAR